MLVIGSSAWDSHSTTRNSPWRGSETTLNFHQNPNQPSIMLTNTINTRACWTGLWAYRSFAYLLKLVGAYRVALQSIVRPFKHSEGKVVRSQELSATRLASIQMHRCSHKSFWAARSEGRRHRGNGVLIATCTERNGMAAKAWLILQS